MKIDLQGKFNVYRPTSEGAGLHREGTRTMGTGKTDQASFERGTTTVVDKSLLGLKSDIQRYVSAPADPERVQELTDKVRGGSYSVFSECLAKAILNQYDEEE